jgi:very-short-patch-repair endonuclease
MAWPLMLIGLGAIAVGAFWMRERSLRAGNWPVRARQPLSTVEQMLYWRLCEAFPDHVILAQVAIAQLLEVENVVKRRAVFNRYRQLVADFVVCTKAFRVVAAIELDDRSHMNPGRADADARKSAALGAAGILLLRFHANSLPSTGQLRSLLDNPSNPPAALTTTTSSVDEQRRALA